ncbi:MAG TPA: DNA helicase RecQ [Treponema sp.]|nr:DNA helicase RecQ [Treponema sp.]
MTICTNPAACVGARPETVLKSVFGYESFRPLQKEIITNVLSGKDTLAVMPTGGGKSLCYQIPALIFDGLTVVVSPLIALMQDQVSALVSNGVDAVFLNSSLEWSDYCRAADSIRAGGIKLVYVSPEGLATQRMQELLHSEGVKINCITIDEAHCISEWGHDFRPDYLEIASFRSQFPDAVCLALTATATKQVREDIVKNLSMKTPEIFVASFNRENIFLEVQPKRDAFGQVVGCIDKHKDESGIIYCFSRKEVDTLTQSLADMGYSVLNYHAGLTDAERSEHQEKFIRDRVSIMVATVAFGMGIDKPNVRFVIHYDMPKSLEQYYQEIGRAGRDGLPSHALLLYSPADIHKIRYFFDESADGGKAEVLLQGMISYATSRTCRRRALLRYFGEEYICDGSGAQQDGDAGSGRTACCDVCAAGPIPLTDVTVPVQKLLSCIIRTQQRFGAAYVIDVLLGSRNKRITGNGHNMLSTWGIGRELSKNDWFELVEQLIERGYLYKAGEYNILTISAEGRDFLAARRQLELPVRLEGGTVESVGTKVAADSALPFILHKKEKLPVPGRTVDKSDDEAVRIASGLKEWRRRTADEENVPPYVIFGDRTLADIAAKKPATNSELLNIYGIGATKAEKFGPAVLRIVRNE